MVLVGSRHASACRTGGLCALIALGLFTFGCADRASAPSAGAQGASKEKDEEQRTKTVTAAPSAAATSASGLDGLSARESAPSPSASSVARGYGPPPSVFAPGDFHGGAGTLGGRHMVAGDMPRTEQVAALPRLDPNARYATTYRPGGAALAAFDAALSRGSIPAVYKDLVGDFGSRYAPAMAKPESGALSFQVETERAAIGPNGGNTNLRIAIRSSESNAARAQLSVHLVLDVSGSMSGPAIKNARDAAETLVQKLDATDDFSMVTFSSDAKVLVSDGPIGPRRQLVLAKIREVQADGGTNISAGLDLGYQQAHSPAINGDAVKIVMLLSDGHANAGDTNPASLAERSAKAFQDGIQTSSFGLGADFDAPLMSSFADRGAGGYYYLADSTQIAPALTRELDARLVPVAQAVEVRVRLRPDVVSTKVFGSRQLNSSEAFNVRQQEIVVDGQSERKDKIKADRQHDAEGGMRFFMPAFARDDRHAMMLTLQLPPGVGERSIASVEVRYKDRIAKKNVTQEIPVKIKYAASDAASAATWNTSVRRTAQAFAAGDAIMQAADLVDRGNRDGAARLLAERAEILKAASTELGEPQLMDDGSRLARLSGAVTGTGAVQDPLPLAVMLRGSSYGYLR